MDPLRGRLARISLSQSLKLRVGEDAVGCLATSARPGPVHGLGQRWNALAALDVAADRASASGTEIAQDARAGRSER